MRRVLTIYAAMLIVAGLLALESRAARDPFWPVGYSPAAPAPIVAEVVQVPSTNTAPAIPLDPPKPDPLLMERVAAELQSKIRQQCNVSGFMKSGSQNMAIVNGQIKRVGDALSFLIEGRSYNFKVTAISPMSVKIEPVN